MTIEIRNRWNNAVMHTVEADSMIEAVVKLADAKANLRDADLVDADLRDADLRGADLRDANLGGANLRGADLRGANLGGANLGGANLRGAYLRGADLGDADLRGADLGDANLGGANLHDAILPHFQICPEIGSFIGFKKLDNGDIATLLIPDDAKRTSSLVGRKCRASKVRVLSGNGASPTCKHSGYTPLTYREGDTVEADNYDDDIRVECAGGIHFFMTRREAEEWTI
jgi:hypothetical protein